LVKKNKNVKKKKHEKNIFFSFCATSITNGPKDPQIVPFLTNLEATHINPPANASFPSRNYQTAAQHQLQNEMGPKDPQIVPFSLI
jgi:hypothetical protein